MDDTDNIMVAVQTILEIVQEEFAAASAKSEDGRWTGLDADSKHRIDVKARDEVNRLRAVFKTASNGLDAMLGLRLTAAELEALEADLTKQSDYYDKLLAALPADPADVTKATDAQPALSEQARAIGWPELHQQPPSEPPSSGPANAEMSSSSSMAGAASNG